MGLMKEMEELFVASYGQGEVVKIGNGSLQSIKVIMKVNQPYYLCSIKGTIFASSYNNDSIKAKINDENIEVGTNYKWNGLYGICDDLKGNLLVADRGNKRIVRVNLK